MRGVCVCVVCEVCVGGCLLRDAPHGPAVLGHPRSMPPPPPAPPLRSAPRCSRCASSTHPLHPPTPAGSPLGVTRVGSPPLPPRIPPPPVFPRARRWSVCVRVLPPTAPHLGYAPAVRPPHPRSPLGERKGWGDTRTHPRKLVPRVCVCVRVPPPSRPRIGPPAGLGVTFAPPPSPPTPPPPPRLAAGRGCAGAGRWWGGVAPRCPRVARPRSAARCPPPPLFPPRAAAGP